MYVPPSAEETRPVLLFVYSSLNMLTYTSFPKAIALIVASDTSVRSDENAYGFRGVSQCSGNKDSGTYVARLYLGSNIYCELGNDFPTAAIAGSVYVHCKRLSLSSKEDFIDHLLSFGTQETLEGRFIVYRSAAYSNQRRWS